VRPRASRAVAALLLLATLTGCDFGSATSRTRPTPSELPAAPVALERFYDQQVEWTTCGETFECARVEVPLDYAEPGRAVIELAVNRRPADDLDRWQGAVLVNPGGPGVSGRQYARLMGTSLGEVTATFDVVGFDPRGVEDSAAVDCFSDAELDGRLAMDSSPDTAVEVEVLEESVVTAGTTCEERSGALLGHISTMETARDMDILRHVVGDPVLHYFGASYGTLLGAVYAELFPDRVARMVLDAAVDPTVEGADLALDQVGGFESALQSYLADCVTDECPLGSTIGEANQNLVELLQRIDREPLPGDGGRDLTSGLAFYGMALPLYVEEAWPLLTQALAAAVRGDGAQLLRLSDLYTSRGEDGYTDNSMEAFLAINCLDDPSARTPGEVERDLSRFTEVSPTFGPTFAWSTLGCPDWPVRAAEPIPAIDAAGAKPILVVGTTRDPATPYPWAESLARQLASGVLLTRDGNGHGAFGHGNECIDQAVVDYLVTGAVPADGTTC
jgi:pimeloyl-ACP methyl ester carboxylesterase